jgi:hypothetical protein
MTTKFGKAIQLFDAANSKDPFEEIVNGIKYPKELLYAQRMSEQLNTFEPNACESVKLAVRCQHICRWEIPRDSYEMTRIGYLTWRKDLYKFHAKKAGEILSEVGYESEAIEKVAFLLQKKQLKKNEDTQLLEDVICLVFLNYYFEKFSKKYSEEKLLDIVRKTWAKMSEKGHNSALQLVFSEDTSLLIKKALS